MEFIQKDILNVTISGGCGRISFELIPLLCNGLVFGNKQKICLNLYGIKIKIIIIKI
jgi:hypothetical protein